MVLRSITPNANVPANRTPTAVSKRSPLLRATQPMASAVPTAATEPPMYSGMPSMNAMTRPGNAAWLTASPMNARPLSTTNVPITAHTMPTMSAASRPRCMKP